MKANENNWNQNGRLFFFDVSIVFPPINSGPLFFFDGAIERINGGGGLLKPTLATHTIQQ